MCLSVVYAALLWPDASIRRLWLCLACGKHLDHYPSSGQNLRGASPANALDCCGRPLWNSWIKKQGKKKSPHSRWAPFNLTIVTKNLKDTHTVGESRIASQPNDWNRNSLCKLWQKPVCQAWSQAKQHFCNMPAMHMGYLVRCRRVFLIQCARLVRMLGASLQDLNIEILPKLCRDCIDLPLVWFWHCVSFLRTVTH